MARTLAEQIVADVSTVFLNADEFAESVTRHVAGVADAGTDVAATGIFIEDAADRSYETGDKITRTATLQIAETVSITDRDAWTIRSQRWETQKGEYGPRVDGGMRTIRLERVEKIQTSRGERTLR